MTRDGITMSKCNKVKNPCKICLGPVTQKTGLQCQGACESWVHYSCLNYTPGRIKDIKAGIIKVTCPCPDCKTSMPKEYRTDEAFSCTNIMCPANRPPQCSNMKCPIHEGLNKTIQTPGFPMQGNPCPLGKCGNDCKQHANPMPPLAGGPPLSTPCDPQNPVHQLTPMTSSSDKCIDYNRCPSGCSSNGNVAGDMRRPPNQNMNYGPAQPNQNYYPNATETMNSNGPSLSTMEQMCNTIGLLSNQINNMMTKMRNASNANPNSNSKNCCATGHKNGNHSDQKAMCPKPCFCTQNPGGKKC